MRASSPMRSHRKAMTRRLLPGLGMLAGPLALAGCTFALWGCGATVGTSWSPTGQAVAYAWQGELRLYDLETGLTRRLDAGTEMAMAPSWSPDGKVIAFYAVTMGEKGSVSLRAVDVASGELRMLIPDVWPLPREVPAERVEAGQFSEEALSQAQGESAGLLLYTGRIAWSPDSKRLACVAASASEGTVLLMEYPSGTPKPAVLENGCTAALAWSPDGKRLAYVCLPGPPAAPFGADEGGNEPMKPGALRVYDLEAGDAVEVCKLTEDQFVLGTPLEWSDDSKEIGFISGDPANHRAIGCIVEARPGAVMRKEVKGVTENAAWSPGLRGVAFVEDRGPGNMVLLYKGLRPPALKALGVLPLSPPPPPAEAVQVEESQQDNSNAFSLPQFSPDRRKVALRVGNTPESTAIAVFPVP